MIVGMDVLAARRFDALHGRRVGLLSHQAALTRNGTTSAQCLRAALGNRLAALYGPEHGFFGQAGAGVHTTSRRHPDWGIPVHSLYGERRKPTPAMLSGLDLMVCDLQDLGVRCYTYLATLRNMLEACRDAGLSVLVTDRPIPLPRAVDGPMPDADALGFVTPCMVPLVYGMTPAESALWLRHTLFPDLRLDVVPMEGWTREDAAWDGQRPAFLPPSPGIRTWESAMTYAATVFCEALSGIDCGRNTNLAFRVLGAPWLRAGQTCARLKSLRLAGVAFTPYRYTAAGGTYDGRELDGILLTVTDPARFAPATVSLALLQTLAEQYGPRRVWHHKGVRPTWFDTLYGTATTRRDLRGGRPFREIAAEWRTAQRAFQTARAAVLLY
ncbi:MAG TPA: DUF1343 domain-containing protein [Kiritimatiellia bacterium]|jgi:uncharacterized protein YbbC (DUF1343 family)|nr:DUF1343 domain-containing protein [Kiritimatiellia bacterium]HPW75623.1 DUF1343 domain-containing protein [Kiritimatiellia bacterium]